MISGNLLPLTNYLANGQYIQVQPIVSKFAERCIFPLLTPKLLYWISGNLLPLTNYLTNGQYIQVQPIVSKFAERCILPLLTTKLLYWISGHLLPLTKLCSHFQHHAHHSEWGYTPSIPPSASISSCYTVRSLLTTNELTKLQIRVLLLFCFRASQA